MDTIWQDIRYGFRMLARKPGFTLVAIVTLALGIGANSAIFSVVDATLLRPLPFREPQQLVQLWMTESAEGSFPLTGQDFLDWRAQNHTFEEMCVYSFQESLNASGGGEPERAATVEIQPNYFSTLGVQPILGRTFAWEENQAGQNHVAVLSYGFWQRRFGGLGSAVNSTVELNSEPYKVVGIMPAWFRVPGAADVWIPLDMSAKNLGPRDEHHLRALGRVKKGTTIAQARAELLAISQRLEQEFPDSNRDVHAVVVPLQEQLVGDSRTQLWLMFGAVALVLLIACANVANLLLARATDRRREVAVRAAMGAEGARLVRQLLTESVLLSLLGAIPGIALAYYCVYFLKASNRIPFTQPNPVAVSPVVLLFTLSVSVLIGLLFGLAPTMQISHLNLSEELKSGGKMAATATSRSRWVRDALVVAEVALSLALLASAGLLLRTFANLREVSLGVDAEKVLSARINTPQAKYSTGEQRWLFWNSMIQRLVATPGVEAAAITTEIPLEGGNNGYITVDGRSSEDLGGQPLVEWTSITPNYFRAMGIPLLAGRSFTEADLSATASTVKQWDEWEKTSPTRGATPDLGFVAVINRTMARKYWPQKDAVGQVFRRGGPNGARVQVVGIVGDTKQWGLRQAPISQAYFPLTAELQDTNWPCVMVVRATGDPLRLVGALRTLVRFLDPSLAVYHVETLRQVIADSMAGESNQTALLGTFAGLALLLAAVGIYGVMAYLVTQRTGEIGIRMALGAGRGDVIWMVVRQGLALVLAGIVVGVAGTLATAKLLGTLLYGVKPNDPATLGVVSAVMCAVALLACVIPAARAMRVNPVIALRYE